VNPAQYVISEFGGLRETARAIGRHHTSVKQWLETKLNGGKGGLIPSDNHKRILKEAAKRGLDITPDHLIYGDKIPQPSKLTPKPKE